MKKKPNQSKKRRLHKRKARKVIFTSNLMINAKSKQVNFADIAWRSLSCSAEILRCYVPQGRIEGHEYTALNPKRSDQSMGSFKINLKTGRWADFATGDRGGDLISLVAYITDQTQLAAALEIQNIIGG